MIGGDDPMLDPFVRPLAAWLGTCAHVDVAWRIAPRLGRAAMHAALRRGRAADIARWLVDAPPPPPPSAD